ncbi:quaking related 54B isoform X2 [Leptinotarsa decemlineata]|uniref:quaking related 54B isoform X2 n=1 Tax=Leptinotarsa decemlineata TaxID=7539 RepID=UPI003D304A3A
MTDKYDSNGDYYGDNFKRDKNSKGDTDMAGESEESALASQKASEYVRELLAEKLALDQVNSPNAARLIEQEVAKVQQIGKAPLKENKYVDIYREKPIKVTVKVLVPVREHPKFNFVGKLLGPKGNSMKRLQEETMCKMAVLGRGSMKDRQKEDELRNSLDPKYSHLTDDLHVEISALGPPAEAHARVAYALAEVRKYLIPDNNDIIRQEQMREMEIMTGDGHGGHGGPHGGHGGHGGGHVGERPRRPPQGMMRSAIPRPPPVMRTATRAPVVTPRVMPAKTKIMSILDRARVAMEESYGYEEEQYEAPAAAPYDYSHNSRPYSSNQYDDYEPDYYRGNSSNYVRPGPSKQFRGGPQRWKNY